MVRRPLAIPNKSLATAHSETNAVAQTFLEQITATFGELILPKSFGEPFLEHDAPLYVADRKVLDDSKSTERLYYERWFHSLYYPTQASNDRMLFIEGKEGIGKSTFIRYYFDSFLPKLLASAKDMEHFVLYADLRRCPDTGTLDKTIYREFRRQIKRRYRNLSTEFDYEMWNRICDWSDPLHERAAKGVKHDYRARKASGHIDHDETFVEEALHYLTTVRAKLAGRPHYVSAVFDNIDQQTLDVQHHLLQKIMNWLGPTLQANAAGSESNDANISFWKVVLPVRPETLPALTSSLEPYQKKDTLPLGPVCSDVMLEQRGMFLKEAAANTHLQVDIDYPHEDGVVYLPLTNAEAVTELGQLMSEATSPTEDEDSSQPVRSTPTHEFVESLCNLSMRRLLRTRKRLLLNPGICEPLTSRKDRPRRPLTPYRIICALLTGPHDVFDRDDADNDFINMYDSVRNITRCEYTTLVGPFAMTLLMRDDLLYNNLVSSLVGIGFHAQEVDECIRSLQECSLVRVLPLKDSRDRVIVRDVEMLGAHLSLLRDPAYVDTMAQCTPIEEHRLEGCTPAVPYIREHFYQRGLMSCRLIEQLWSDETKVSTWHRGTERQPMKDSEFKADFERLRLPRVSVLAARAVYTRIKYLFDKRDYYLENALTAQEWTRLLTHEALRHRDKSDIIEAHLT